MSPEQVFGSEMMGNVWLCGFILFKCKIIEKLNSCRILIINVFIAISVWNTSIAYNIMIFRVVSRISLLYHQIFRKGLTFLYPWYREEGKVCY